jgi:hypothetical protein
MVGLRLDKGRTGDGDYTGDSAVGEPSGDPVVTWLIVVFLNWSILQPDGAAPGVSAAS